MYPALRVERLLRAMMDIRAHPAPRRIIGRASSRRLGIEFAGGIAVDGSKSATPAYSSVPPVMASTESLTSEHRTRARPRSID
jgi:hypothetical protein